MNVQSEEKKMLIESMKKLVSHVSNNPLRQNEIFDALSLQDLNKIIINLKDDNEYLRRISSLLLCELFYRNARTKTGATKLLGVQPKWGRICVSGIPESIQKYPSTLKKCIELMQSPAATDEDDKFCWIINLEKKSLKLETLDQKKFSLFTFIDPVKNIFGFSIKDPNSKKVPQTEQKEIKNVSTQLPSGRQRIVSNSPITDNKSNSQFYNNYLEYKNRSKDTKRYSVGGDNVSLSINHQSDKKESQTRHPPPTTREIASPYYSKRQDMNTSIDANRPQTIQNISQYARNSYNGVANKMNTSYQQIADSRRISQTYNMKTSMNEQRASKEKQIQTYRKTQSIEPRSSDAVNKQRLIENENLYRKVKDILKK